MITESIVQSNAQNITRDTLAIMGRTANEAAMTPLFREWAAVSAARAGQRNYVGQLKEVYDEIMRRWRYVGEPGEWVHGSASSLIDIVLGTKYNGAPNASNLRLSTIPSTKKGWGDCDCVSTLVAAAVRALGMKAWFRVAHTEAGGHVSVVARTQRGEIVSLDPVGEPEHSFGWMLPARADQVRYYDLNAAPAPNLGCGCEHKQKTALMRIGATAHRPIAIPTTHLAELRQGVSQPHVIAVRAGYLSAIDCTDALHGVDEHGQDWRYNANTETWQLEGFFDNVKRRWKKRIRAVKNVVQKVRKLHNKIVSKILASKVGQRLVGTVLMAYGVPPAATRAVMQVGSAIIANDGLIGFIKLLKKSPKAALQMVAQAAKKGLIASGLVPEKAKQFLSGVEADDGETSVIDRDGEIVPVAELSAIVELAGEPQFVTAASTPDLTAEKTNAIQAVTSRQTTYNGRSQGSTSDDDWYTNLAYWGTYPQAPVKIANQKVWVAAWKRIYAIVKAELKRSPSVPASTKTTSKTSTSSGFARNPNESQIAVQTVVDRPASQVHRGKTFKRKSNQSDQEWFTDAAYFRAYAEGPSKLGKSGPYVDAWRRIADVIRQALVKSSTPKTTPKSTVPTTTKKTSTPKSTVPTTTKKTSTPKSTVPTTTQKTVPASTEPTSSNCWEDDLGQQSICQDVQRNPNEVQIVRDVVAERPTRALIRGQTMNQTGSEADWLANLAYWRGYPEGPLQIPESAPQYAQAWVRMKNEVVREIKASKKKSTTTPHTDLPDVVDPPFIPPIEPPRPPIEPPHPPIEPKQGINWLPIAAGIALMLLSK